MSNDNIHDSQKIMEKLSNSEKNLIGLGEKIKYLLGFFQNVLEGQRNEDAKEKETMILILKDIDSIKAEMHSLIDKVYAEKSFPYLSKIANDNKQQEKEIDQIKEMIVQNFQFNRQFRVDKK